MLWKSSGHPCSSLSKSWPRCRGSKTQIFLCRIFYPPQHIIIPSLDRMDLPIIDKSNQIISMVRIAPVGNAAIHCTTQSTSCGCRSICASFSGRKEKLRRTLEAATAHWCFSPRSSSFMLKSPSSVHQNSSTWAASSELS